ncbi:MAG: hypothetical protein QOE92_1724 [Chloroflexota bacterium]|nr:hypothetical protein [Chloroflexota bacterium]
MSGDGDDRARLEFKPLRRSRRRDDPGPERLSDLMVPTLSRLGLRTRARHLQVIGAWSEVVGEAVAEQTAVVAFSRGRVTVETQSPAMGHQLHLQRQEILEGLNRVLEETVVTDLRFRLAPGAGAPRR